VIRFKCIYCGQRIAVNDDLAGRNGKCPTCGHELHVPKKITPLIDTNLSESQLEEKARAKLDMMNAEIDSSGDLADLVREDAGWLIPVYDEMSLFLMSMTLILLYAVNEPFQEQIRKWAAICPHSYVFIAAAILITGMGLSIYNVFTTREKTDTEKWIMLFFAVLTNAGTGIISGWYVLSSSSIRDWLIIFPVWNIINGVLLIVMLFKIIDKECVSDRDASLKEVVIGLIAVLIVFILCNYVLKLHWAVTLSICIIYTTSFDRGLQSVFPVLAGQDDEHVSGG
jgi:DNA-directed RNA polymerase subunit RPC12/RpoP